jgi:biopolymer transport protein TolQ
MSTTMTFLPSAWAAGDSIQVATNIGAFHAIESAGLVVQFTLLLLSTMSVVSWAIMIHKRNQFRAVENGNLPFEERFWQATSLDQAFESLKEFPNSNLAAVFRQGYLELRKLADSKLASSAAADGAAPSLTGIDNLQRSLRKATDIELSRLEARLSFLATVGSVGPFVGLFGTVWGIMSSFERIGATGMASLAVVAPGIAEALIATGVGLAAAIPASVGYNMFVTRVRRQEMDLNNFSADFLNLAKRNFFRDS